MTESRDEAPKFRADYLDLITGTAARVIPGGSAPHRFDRLSHPERHSPFLTLALRSEQGRRTHVVKVLVVLRTESHNRFEGWSQVLEQECERLKLEFEERQRLPDVLGSLALPLLDPEAPVVAGELPPLRHVDLMERTGSLGDGDTAFPFFVRPYVPWPRLQETGYRLERMRKIFEEYCRRKKIQRRTSDSGPASNRDWKYFVGAALVSGVRAGEEDVLLASEWRFHREPEE